MLVNEVMSRNVEVSDPGTVVRALARTMRDKDIGAIPVVENDRLVGMVTDRDIVVRCVAEGRDGVFSRVADAMNSPAICCRDSDTLEQAKELALRSGVRRLPVLDSANRVVGLFKADGKAPAEVKTVEELPRISA